MSTIMAAPKEKQLSNSICFLILISLLHEISCGNRVADVMYQKLEGNMACFKRFNGTHEVGCTSKQGGNVGVIQVINGSDESTSVEVIDWLISDGPNAPYILALEPNYLTVEILSKVNNSDGKINGVVVLWEADKDAYEIPQNFSPQNTCPNDLLSIYKDLSSHKDFCDKPSWNPAGNSILFSNYNFPMFLMTDETSIEAIKNCYGRWNDPAKEAYYPLCAVELDSSMFGTTNSEVCLRRASLGLMNTVNFCDRLHDFNIYGSLKPMNQTEGVANDSVIVVATRVDSLSLFNKISPGANSAVTGLVTLALVADAINKAKSEILAYENDKNVFFVMFEGEAWDYIGSSRMVWDMQRGEFPFRYIDGQADQMAQLSLKNIDLFIEISQVGKAGLENSKFYMHTDPISQKNDEIKTKTDRLIKDFITTSGTYPNINFLTTDEEAELPPASFQSFLRHRNISGIVVADHKISYENHYLDSIFDDYRNLGYKSTLNSTDDEDQLHVRLYELANIIAKVVAFQLTNDEAITPQTDEVFANDLLHCYLRNVNCTIFRDHASSSADFQHDSVAFFTDEPARMYASVFHGEDELSQITSRLFARILGDVDNVTESECLSNSSQIYHHYYYPLIDEGLCVLSTVRQSVAQSPAFSIVDYDWNSGLYSTWTESGWAVIQAQIFLIPSPGQEIGLLVSGSIVVIFSFAFTYFVNKKADVLFNFVPAPTNC